MIDPDNQIIILKDGLESIDTEFNEAVIRKTGKEWNLNIKNNNGMKINVGFTERILGQIPESNTIYINYSFCHCFKNCPDSCCTFGKFSQTETIEIEDPNSIDELIAIINNLIYITPFKSLESAFATMTQVAITKAKNETKVAARSVY